MIEVENLSKRYGEKLAAGGLDFVVRPGIVTGFLGPNGAGRLDGVTKTCQSGVPPALAQISMGVAAGEVVAVMSPSGCGRLIADTTVEEFVARAGGSAVGGVRDADIVHAIAPDAAIRRPAYSAAFHAMTTGTNTVRFPTGTITGYRAASGWNPVTGWEAPDAQVLIRFLFVTASGPLGRQRS